MLGLTLRKDFLSDQMRETAITFYRDDHSGAVEIDPREFFNITYPSIDLQRALKAIDKKSQGRPIILLGERGRGKSHIMAAMHHALKSPEDVEGWAKDWAKLLNEPFLGSLDLHRGYTPIAVSMHNNEYLHLWDVLFKKHPQGQRFLGRFEAENKDVPSRSLIEEMLGNQPVALILDELQSWYDGTRDEPGYTGRKFRSWAFSFLQNLSEIVVEHPELLILVISVRDTSTDAYRQPHRNNPILIDFKDPMARLDRQRLALHRIFENRRYISEDLINAVTENYRQERFRLSMQNKDAGSEAESSQNVLDAWPFSPELLEVLEDQILRSAHAQGLRDLIRILAFIYRDHGENQPLLTPADFTINGVKDSGVESLLDAVSNAGQQKLREIAIRNLEAVQQAKIMAPHVTEIMSALWMRSFSVEDKKGATSRQLHVDITHAMVIDDNLFSDEIDQIVMHSFNIHSELSGGERRFFFKEEENPRSKLLASARNDSVFEDQRDRVHIRKTLRALLSPTSMEATTRVIVLGPNWNVSPWVDAEDADRPERWDRPVLIVLPESLSDINATLGVWLKNFVSQKRNTVRFLIPKAGSLGLYEDPEIFLNARAGLLAEEWKKQYQQTGREFSKKLDELLENRFDRYAVLQTWNFQIPVACKFIVGQPGKKAAEVARAIDEKLKNDHFELEAFEALVNNLATKFRKVDVLLQELREPPSTPLQKAIVYLGEKEICEQLLHLVAEQKLALNVHGEWIKRSKDHRSDKEAYDFAKRAAFKQGREFADMTMALPSLVGQTAFGATSTEIVYSKPEPIKPNNVNASPIKQDSWLTGDLWRNAGSSYEVKPTQVVPPSSPIPNNVSEAEASYVSKQKDISPDVIHHASQKYRSEVKGPLSLSAQFEQWGLATNETIPVARLEFTGMRVAELKQLLQKLPPSVRSILEVEFDEG